MINKRDIKIEELPNKKKFLIKVYIEDEVTPEEFIKHYESINQSKEQGEKDLNSIDEQVKIRKELLGKELKNMEDELKNFNDKLQKANLWKKENELKNQRSNKPTEQSEVTPSYTK